MALNRNFINKNNKKFNNLKDNLKLHNNFIRRNHLQENNKLIKKFKINLNNY